MAGLSDTFENDLLKLILHGTAITSIADNAASSPYTSYWVCLHTADPGETGTSTTNEATYTGYARVEVTRNSSGWTITGSLAENAAAIIFGACTGGDQTITHASLTVASTGSSKILFFGELDIALSVLTGAPPPTFPAGDFEITAN